MTAKFAIRHCGMVFHLMETQNRLATGDFTKAPVSAPKR